MVEVGVGVGIGVEVGVVVVVEVEVVVGVVVEVEVEVVVGVVVEVEVVVVVGVEVGVEVGVVVGVVVDMRIVVFGYPHTSKTTVEVRLLEMHKRDKLSMVIGWTRSAPSCHAYEWADRKGINCALVGGTGTPLMGVEHGKRAEIGAIFKTYVPHRLVVFGDEALTEGGAGRMFAKTAEKYGSELVYEQAAKNGTRVQELCGELSPNGLYRCTRYKEHLGKYHYFVKDGRLKARFQVIHNI